MSEDLQLDSTLRGFRNEVSELLHRIEQLEAQSRSDDQFPPVVDEPEHPVAPPLGFEFAGWSFGSGLITGVRIRRGIWTRTFPDDRPISNGPGWASSPHDTGKDYYTLDITSGLHTVYANLKWPEAADFNEDPITFSLTPVEADFWHYPVALFTCFVSGALGYLGHGNEPVQHVGDIETDEYRLGVGSGTWGAAAPKSLVLDGTTLKLMGFLQLWIRPGGILHGNGDADFAEGATAPDPVELSSVDLSGICGA